MSSSKATSPKATSSPTQLSPRCRFHRRHVYISDEARRTCPNCSTPDVSALPCPKWFRRPGDSVPAPSSLPVPLPRARALDSDWRARGAETQGPVDGDGDGDGVEDAAPSHGIAVETEVGVEDAAPSHRIAVETEGGVERAASPRNPPTPPKWVASSLKKLKEDANWEFKQSEQSPPDQEAVPEWILSSRRKLSEEPNWEFVLSKRNPPTGNTTEENAPENNPSEKNPPEENPLAENTPDDTTPNENMPEETTHRRRDSSRSRARADAPPVPATDQQNAPNSLAAGRWADHAKFCRAAFRDEEFRRQWEWLASRQFWYEVFQAQNPNLRYKDFDLIDAFIDPPPPRMVTEPWPVFFPAVFPVDGSEVHQAGESSRQAQENFLQRPQPMYDHNGGH